MHKQPTPVAAVKARTATVTPLPPSVGVDSPASTVSPAAAGEMPLPHERDESVDRVGGGAPSSTVAQAFHDVSCGLVDTDRGPGVDRTFQKLKA